MYCFVTIVNNCIVSRNSCAISAYSVSSVRFISSTYNLYQILYFSDETDQVNKVSDVNLNKKSASTFLNRRRKRDTWIEEYCEAKEEAVEQNAELIVPCANSP